MSTLAAPLPHGPSSAADPAEGRRYGGAFRVSAALHLILLGLVVVLTMIVREKDADKPAIFELVAGEGDNFLALDAPSGNEAGRAAEGEIEFTSPDPVPVWTPPAPAAAEPEPAAPTPVTPVEAVAPPTPVKPAPAPAVPVPNFTKAIKQTIRAEERKADKEIQKQRAADQKAAAEAAKRTSYEQFQKQNAKTTGSSSAKSTATGTGAAASPGKRIDVNSLKRGVTGGTGAGSTGAGGTALSRAEANAMDAYFALLMQRLRENHEKPAGLSDLLNAQVAFTMAADGSISGVRIVASSGNADFDQSVLEAFNRVKMPARPDKKTAGYRITFRIKEA
jgi:colicin import membrane protein